MEEEEQVCLEEKECIDTPSVIIRLSAVSLTDVDQGSEGVIPSSASASHADTLSAMAQAPQSTSAGGAAQAACMDVSDETCVDVSHAMSVDVSHAACANVPCAMQQDAVAEQVNGPCWSEMVPDALVKIFNHLPLESKLCTIPCVCRTWRFVSQSAPCWQNVDLSEWSSDGRYPKTLERMLLLVLNWSGGCLQEICAPSLKNDAMLRLIADSGSQLQVLRIPDSFVSEECLCELAPKLTSLTYLDISGRYPSKALIEAFGNHCPFITRLNLNMRLNASTSKSCDVAALSVAQYMPQLKHLEMAYGLLSNVGFTAILESCTSLEHLDLRGCWHVNMDEATNLNAKRRIKVFLDPVVQNDIYDISDYDNIDDDDDDDDNTVDYDDYYDDFLSDECDIEFMDEDIYLW